MSGSAYLPRRRVSLILPILLMHAAVLAVVAMNHVAVPARPSPSPGLAIFDLPSIAVVRQATRPAAAVKVALPLRPVVAPMLAEPVAMPSVPGDTPFQLVSSGCDLTDTVQSALRSDAAVRDAMAALPVDARSVANAVMLWQAYWIDGDTPAAREALAHIRDVIVATVMGASDECRTQLQAGPRLIAVAGPPDITFALGSGNWRWGDLVAPAGSPQIASAQTDRPNFHQTEMTQGEY